MTAPSAKAAPTALPWCKCPTHGRMLETYCQTRAIVQVGKANLIAGVFGDVAGGEETAEANAELIVRAVNSHDELVTALECAINALTCFQVNLTAPDCRPTFQIARAALAKAKGNATP